MNPGITQCPFASHTVAAFIDAGGSPLPIATILPSAPTAMYPVKGSRSDEAIEKMYAFRTTSFAGACATVCNCVTIPSKQTTHIQIRRERRGIPFLTLPPMRRQEDLRSDSDVLPHPLPSNTRY